MGTDENWEWGTQSNVAGFLRLGYAFDSNWRVTELEGRHRLSLLRRRSVREFFLFHLCTRRPASICQCRDADATTVMANVLYDVQLGLPVHPFIGGGGITDLAMKAHGTYPFCDLREKDAHLFCLHRLAGTPMTAATGSAFRVSCPSWPFAPGCGVGCHLSLCAQQRRDLDGADREDLLFSGERFRGDYSDNSVTIGLRYDFGG